MIFLKKYFKVIATGLGKQNKNKIENVVAKIVDYGDFDSNSFKPSKNYYFNNCQNLKK